jgi:hypothetical protein
MKKFIYYYFYNKKYWKTNSGVLYNIKGNNLKEVYQFNSLTKKNVFICLVYCYIYSIIQLPVLLAFSFILNHYLFWKMFKYFSFELNKYSALAVLSCFFFTSLVIPFLGGYSMFGFVVTFFIGYYGKNSKQKEYLYEKICFF